MKKYVFAIDLDGTLLNNKGKLNNKTIKYVNEIINSGHKLIIASGRPFLGLLEFAKSFPPNTPIISENGAYIGALDNSLSNIIKSFNKEDFLKLFKDNKDIIKNGFYSVLNHAFIYNRIAKLEPFYHITSDTIVTEGAYDEIEDILEPNGLLLIIDASKIEQFETYLNNEFNGTINYRLMGSDKKNAVYEISQTVMNKSYALERIQTKLFPKSAYSLVVIGDGDNDIDMLKTADISVAMKNASSEVKKIAKYITKCDNNHNGVIKFINKFLKSQE